jgi:hypothetical protein
MKRWVFVWIGVAMSLTVNAQVYTEKQTRHRFAQLNLGFDVQATVGGKSFFLDEQDQVNELPLNPLFAPRFVIGGTHFWGHADFYIAIPLLRPSFSEQDQKVYYTNSVKTVFKYYPWRMEHHKLRPFIGLSLTPASFMQENQNLESGNGPRVTKTTLPLTAGGTFNAGNHLVEVSAAWHYSNSVPSYFSRTESRLVRTPPLSFSLSYRYMLETTISAERDWQSGRTAEVTGKLEEQHMLNGFFLGAGVSSAWWLSASNYNKTVRPFIPSFGISILPEFGIGYYFHKPDLKLTLNYRSYCADMSTYGIDQEAKRKSIGFEVTKFLFDYHGFAPFAGPVATYEFLSFEERDEGIRTVSVSDQKPAVGIAFGWDIRPNRLQAFLLRNNLRYFLKLELEVKENEYVSFDNIEFNFIELIIYPGRMFSKKFQAALRKAASQ